MKTKIIFMFVILCSISFAMDAKKPEERTHGLEVKIPSMVLFCHDSDTAEYKAWAQNMTKGEAVKPHDVDWYNKNILAPLVGFTQKKESGALLTLALFYRKEIGLDKLPVLVSYFLKEPRFENNVYVLSAAGIADLASGKIDPALTFYDRAKRHGDIFSTVQAIYITALLSSPKKEIRYVEKACEIIRDWQALYAGETDTKVIGADLLGHMQKKGGSKYGSLFDIYDALFSTIKKWGFEKILLAKLIAECERINNIPARLAFIGCFGNYFMGTPYETLLKESKIVAAK
ncbi:MAG: hypothetical protein K2Y18_07510 [Alphaproteobacteria bacterium]|jgi:hypothetical protein|nr:hypothetical protein [Alphaproteobacteria bacterium]